MNQIVVRGEIRSVLKKKHIGSEAYMSFIIAVDCKNRQTGRPERDFVTCEAWGHTADDVFRHFQKGDSIVIIGELRTRAQVEDKGEYLPRIVVSEACFTCGSLVR